MEQYEKIQQLLKKEPGTKERVPIFPPTVIQAVFDAKTGASLEAILAQFNSITVQYQGSPRDTRLAIPMEMRRPGLTITYTTVEGDTLTERANSQVTQDDNWALDTNWSRIDELSLRGNIAVSARGTWIINGADTGIKAVGPKGENGITPWLKEIDNKLHYSYDNVKWTSCSGPLSAQFRNHNNRIQISYDKGKTWTDISDPVATYVRFAATSSTAQDGSIGKIQYSHDKGKTWHDLSPEFRNYLRIQGYVATNDKLPTGVPVGTIYGVGPTYEAGDTFNTNPMYQLRVWDGTQWVNNGYFTSISAGIVQETGDSETEVMSQKAVSGKLSELGSKVGYALKNYLIEGYNYQSNGVLAPNSTWNSIEKIPVNHKFYTNFELSVAISARCFSSDGSVIDTITVVRGLNTVPGNTVAIGIYWNNQSIGENLDLNNIYVIGDDAVYALFDNCLKKDSLANELGNDDLPISQKFVSQELIKRGLYVPDYLIEGYNYQATGVLSKNESWDCCSVLPIQTNFYVNWDGVSVRCFDSSGVVIGTSVADNNGFVEIVEGTVEVGLYWQKDKVQNNTYNDKFVIIEGVVRQIILKNTTSANYIGKKYVKKTTSDLYVKSKLSNTNDIVFHFAKCMANDLFTFSEVYLSSNTNNVVSDSLIVSSYLNRAVSDNIGPIHVPSTSPNGLFVGGNHTTTSGGNIIKTAFTESIKVFIDNTEIANDFEGYVNDVMIEVVNKIYNPLFPIIDDNGSTTGFSEYLCDEIVKYNIGNNNIHVSVSHQYLFDNPKTIIRYYGMQSTFESEIGILTPCGKWADKFTLELGDVTAEGNIFNKGEYPNFSTIIQKSNVGYEIDYLSTKGFGKHNYISDSTFICRRSSDKMYHHLMENTEMQPNSIMNWSGAYIWLDKPIKDDDDIFIFKSNICGDNYLFIISKRRLYDYKIEIPSEFIGKDFKIVKSEDISEIEELNNIINIENAYVGGELIIKC